MYKNRLSLRNHEVFVTRRKAGLLPNKNLAVDIFLDHYRFLEVIRKSATGDFQKDVIPIVATSDPSYVWPATHSSPWQGDGKGRLASGSGSSPGHPPQRACQALCLEAPPRTDPQLLWCGGQWEGHSWQQMSRQQWQQRRLARSWFRVCQQNPCEEPYSCKSVGLSPP